MEPPKAQDLQALFAGGRDIWQNVPIGSSTFQNIQNRVLEPNEESPTTSDWPPVVKEGILYGLTAYNPMGQLETDEYNRKHYDLLLGEIIELTASNKNGIVFWEAASIFPDGGFEPGFIVAFSKTVLNDDQLLDEGRQAIINLAAKYRQAAIYSFEYNAESEQLVRSTIPILVPETDASVVVVMDDSLPFPTDLMNRGK